MTNYAKLLEAMQREPIFGRENDMIKNAAGGYAFVVDAFTVLERFLILGCEGGSYYVNKRNMTRNMASKILACVELDARRVVQMIVEINQTGRAIKPDPSIFALALLAGQKGTEVSKLALEAIPVVCRTGAQLFQFVSQVKEFRGWGRGLRNAVANWYTSKTPSEVLYQTSKYKEREGLTHHILLRLAHPKSQELNPTFHYISTGEYATGFNEDESLYVHALEAVKIAKSEQTVVELIRDYGLVREHIPTTWLNNVAVWEALLEQMPMMAMVRNLGKMSSIGLITPMSEAAKTVCRRLRDTGYVKRSRIHPFGLLLAQTTYSAGHGFRGNLSWNIVPQVVDALQDAFYSSFKYVEPTGKNYLLGIDVSGSMGFRGYDYMGSINNTHIKAYQAAACMALVQMRTEEWCHPVAFSGESFYNSGVVPMEGFSKCKRLDDAVREMEKYPVGQTNCALPMIYARQKKIPVDAFIVYTDNETWSGDIHPTRALKDYRQAMGRDAKLIVCAMTATNYSIADPTDPGMLDIVGFDSSCPKVITEFIND